MIIPTAEYDPMFANDGVPFRTKMIQYIEREFSDLLESPMELLHSDEGLTTLSTTLSNPEADTSLMPRAA